MRTIIETGRTRERRRTAVGLLLACSALATPAFAQTTPSFPAQRSPGPSAADPTSPPSTAVPATNASLSGTGTAMSTADAAVEQNQGVSNLTTGGLVSDDRSADAEPPYEEDLNQPYESPLDPGAEPIDAREEPREPVDPTGIRLGSSLLRPSTTNSINTETIRSGGTERRRD